MSVQHINFIPEIELNKDLDEVLQATVLISDSRKVSTFVTKALNQEGRKALPHLRRNLIEE